MEHHRATRAEINLEAFRHNLRFLRSVAGSSVKIMAVVKADAYGHGAVPCAQAAVEAGADYLGVGFMEEGVELREGGIKTPILVMGGIFPEDIDEIIQHDLAATLYSAALAEAVSRRAGKAEKPVKVHIKVDTGMGRLGVTTDDFPCLVEQVSQNKYLELEGVCTHFSSADEEDPEYTLLQLSRFRKVLQQIEQAGIHIPLVHGANSSALLKYPEIRFDMVRPGIALYGALPSPNLEPYVKKLARRHGGGLTPVMQWKTAIAQLKWVPKGAPLSYGRKHITAKDSRIATLPLGYADGLTRNLSNTLNVLVGGKSVRQVGAICMDMILIDVTDVADVAEGDEAVIFGRQGEQTITVEEVAGKSGSIPYETLCTVGKRVPRVYV